MPKSRKTSKKRSYRKKNVSLLKSFTVGLKKLYKNTIGKLVKYSKTKKSSKNKKQKKSY
jgi:hypothetical protein